VVKDLALSQATAAVADPTTKGADLQAIAAKYRYLWPQVASHPKAYPALLDWLAQNGDDQVRDIIAARHGASSPARPDQGLPVESVPLTASQIKGRGSGRLVAIVAVVVAVLLVAGFAVWWLSGGDNTKPPAPAPATVTITQAGDSNNATETSGSGNPLLYTDPAVASVIHPLSLPALPLLPTTKVQVQGDGFDTSAIQRLADDIAANNVDKIVNSCWTQPPSELRLIYSSDAMRGVILQALAVQPSSAQGGVTWSGQYVTVTALWEEVRSRYTCVSVSWVGDSVGLGSFTPAMAAWRITRILGFQYGAPVHSGDGTNYMLLCDSECGPGWAPHDAGAPHNPDGQVPVLTANARTWERLYQLSQVPLTVELLSNGYYRVRSVDLATPTIAYFTGGYTDYWMPYLLGEVD